MDYRQAAQVIRDEVDMEAILDLYGYKYRHHLMKCPFHGDKAPSLRIYRKPGGWHCFGCGRGGSVIDFVQEQEGCDFRTAVRAIDNALHLGLFRKDEDPDRARLEKEIQKWLDDYVSAVYAYCDALILQIECQQKTRIGRVKVLENRAWEDKQSLTASEWTDILSWKDDDQYDEYWKEQIEQFKEEVAAWRRKRRRAGTA